VKFHLNWKLQNPSRQAKKTKNEIQINLPHNKGIPKNKNVSQSHHNMTLETTTQTPDPATVIALLESAHKAALAEADNEILLQTEAFDAATKCGWDWESDDLFTIWCLKATSPEIAEEGLRLFRQWLKLKPVIEKAVLMDDFDSALGKVMDALDETDGGFAGIHYSGTEIETDWKSMSKGKRSAELQSYVRKSSVWR
jgi:hypothetical protein